MNLLVLWLAACAGQDRVPRTHDAYVLQRDWTEDVADAVVRGDEVLDGFRVRALDVDRAGTWALPDEPLGTLAGRAAVPVARVEPGRPVNTALGLVLGATVTRWRAAGVRVGAVEIDHAVPTSQLAAYAAGLHDVRRGLPEDVALWATALPSWLDDPAALQAVRDAVDGTVLQVHATSADAAGLFDPERAAAWIARYADDRRPYRVSLPAYGVRVDARGRIAARGGRDVWVDPAAVAGLLAALERDPPPGWVGTAWTRLPVTGDQRVWSMSTLAAVIEGGPPPIHTAVVPKNGVYDLVVVNDGVADAPAPERIAVEGACTAADGVGGYQVRRSGGRMQLERGSPAQVPADGSLAVGWARCDGPPRFEQVP